MQAGRPAAKRAKRPLPAAPLPAFAGSEEEGQGAPSRQPQLQSQSREDGQDRVAQLKAQGQDWAERSCWGRALAAWDEALAQLVAPGVAGHAAEQAELYELRAQVLLEVGRDYEAIQAATRATALAPGYAPACLTLARAQLNFGEPRLALRSLQRLLALQPDHAEAQRELGTVQMLALQQQAAGEGTRLAATSPHANPADAAAG